MILLSGIPDWITSVFRCVFVSSAVRRLKKSSRHTDGEPLKRDSLTHSPARRSTAIWILAQTHGTLAVCNAHHSSFAGRLVTITARHTTCWLSARGIGPETSWGRKNTLLLSQ